MGRKKLALILSTILAGILGMHLLTAYHSIHSPDSFLADINIAFDLDREYNFPALISGFLLAMVGFNCYRLYKKRSRSKNSRMWQLLAWFFWLLSFDEIFSLHEDLATPFRELLSISDSGNIFYQAWIIPAAVGIVGFSVGLWWTARRLHIHISKQQMKVIVTAITYMSGVLVLESIGTQAERETTYRLVIIPLEEMFELTLVSFIVWQTAFTKKGG